jgi:glycine cleavage system regulatory protein
MQPIGGSAAVSERNSNGTQNTSVNINPKSSNEQTAPNDNDVTQQTQNSNQQQTQAEELERRQIQDLAARDREVRNHERAHATVGGLYAGSPRYSFERGPDGINYAVGGEVSISAGAVSGDPVATIQKAQVVRRAALAPTDPSAQDRSVAAQATQIESQARVELVNIEAQERIDEQEASEARRESRQADSASSGQTSGSNDANISTEITASSPQGAITDNTDNRFQRLSDDLNLRVSRADPLGTPEPGQIFSQFI